MNVGTVLKSNSTNGFFLFDKLNKSKRRNGEMSLAGAGWLLTLKWLVTMWWPIWQNNDELPSNTKPCSDFLWFFCLSLCQKSCVLNEREKGHENREERWMFRSCSVAPVIGTCQPWSFLPAQLLLLPWNWAHDLYWSPPEWLLFALLLLCVSDHSFWWLLLG